MLELNLDFIKAQGLGNDFVILDCLKRPLKDVDFEGLAVKVCDRHFGIGADGLILVLSSKVADYRMRIINSDGSEPEMCGNGIRCFARYLLNAKLGRTPMAVETLAGIKNVEIVMDAACTTGFRVNMGAPALSAGEIPVSGYDGQVTLQPLEVDGKTYEITCVSMGNPHCVVFTDSVDDIPLSEIGPKIETHPAFPKKTNVEFVEVVGPEEIKVRVWERGAGVTMACGTGACASVVAGVLAGKLEHRALVHLPGGDLEIEWDGDVYMTGPAEEVFRGKIIL
ncbi:MAG: diaminopimelate epimerase [Armatimonadota bacterium]